jgi:hypothetical protein
VGVAVCVDWGGGGCVDTGSATMGCKGVSSKLSELRVDTGSVFVCGLGVGGLCLLTRHLESLTVCC